MEAAEQRVAQLKAEADAKEETAKRLAAQLEDGRQQDERGQCMVEEISELNALSELLTSTCLVVLIGCEMVLRRLGVGAEVLFRDMSSSKVHGVLSCYAVSLAVEMMFVIGSESFFASLGSKGQSGPNCQQKEELMLRTHIS